MTDAPTPPAPTPAPETAAPGSPAAPAIDPVLRERLLAAPDLILGDRDLMRALIGAREAEVGANVVDIRGRAMEALEARLTRLEQAHQSVIAAAYENQTGTQTVHRAVVALLEADDFPGFLDNLQASVAPMLRIDSLRLVMESAAAAEAGGAALTLVPTGTIRALIAAGRRAPRGDDILLRRAADETASIHGPDAGPIRSEALLPLDLGPGRWPALLLMGSADPARFSPAQGTDLLRFFGQVFRLVLIGWLRE